ncbi:hypothetical protein KKF91_16195 [Myxococcota bacterium]|nr:hypothetical protein [Myxococcota bacterium]MBU1432082.1 hypothetical protein [Myxococcota bacterium]MBU1897776.1 hypothetical protein [Myxococcota bacterium]
MARAVLRLSPWFICLALLGCADEWRLEVEVLPLLIFNTYPGNGVTIAQEDVGEVAVTFSEDLGEEGVARDAARRLSLNDERGAIEILREDLTNVSYDPARFTLRVELDPEVQGALLAGDYELLISGEIETDTGRRLPTDYVVRFRVTPR